MLKPNDLESRFRDSLKSEGISSATVRRFRKIIRDYYRENRREMPWRRTRNPYRILVSEVMLQQTQVERVREKYDAFIKAFPDFPALAAAPLLKVLGVWQGLGYNRRAIALRKIAGIVTGTHRGRLPTDPGALRKLPGIGTYSASAIFTFVTNRPSLFMETNIRRVYIHFFFDDRVNIRDDEIIPLLEMTMDRKNPRDWYYALMDYGARLKKQNHNPNRRSAHYQKQSPFSGSNRQLRGMILRALIHAPGLTKTALKKNLQQAPENLDQILDGLVTEGFLRRIKGRFDVP